MVPSLLGGKGRPYSLVIRNLQNRSVVHIGGVLVVVEKVVVVVDAVVVAVVADVVFRKDTKRVSSSRY